MTYFNLSIGSEMTYQSQDDTTSWTTIRYIPEEWEFLGGIYGTFVVRWAEDWIIDDVRVNQNYMLLSKKGSSLLWWGFISPVASVIAKKGLVYVTEPAVVGFKEESITKATLTINGDSPQKITVDFSGNYTIDAIEDVTVPAGAFKDCIKIHEEEITPDGQISFYVWYSPEIGSAVKYYYPQQDNRIDQLESYYIEPDNDPWDNWFMPKIPILVLSLTVVISIVVIVLISVKVIRNKKNTTK